MKSVFVFFGFVPVAGPDRLFDSEAFAVFLCSGLFDFAEEDFELSVLEWDF